MKDEEHALMRSILLLWPFNSEGMVLYWTCNYGEAKIHPTYGKIQAGCYSGFAWEQHIADSVKARAAYSSMPIDVESEMKVKYFSKVERGA